MVNVIGLGYIGLPTALMPRMVLKLSALIITKNSLQLLMQVRQPLRRMVLMNFSMMQ